MELGRHTKKLTGLVAATMLALVLAVGCGNDDPGPKAEVRGVTTVREAPADDDATREMLNEMKRRIAEVKDGQTGNR